MAHEVTLITGDGVGPELAQAARRCVDATGVAIDWDVQEAGVDVMARTGTPLPDAVLESIRRTRCALKAPITTPVGTGFRSINVHLRQELGLFACIRPCMYYAGARTSPFRAGRPGDRPRKYRGPVCRNRVREGKPRLRLLSGRLPSADRKIRTGPDETGISIKPISISGTEQIVRCAFEYARENGRKKVTTVHKANIMKYTDGLYLKHSRLVAEQFPDIEFEDRIVDNMCMQARPEA